MLIIGSSALVHHGVSDRKPRDLDVICTQDEWDALIELAEGDITYGEKLGTKHCYFKTADNKMVELELATEGTTGYELLKIEGALEETKYASLQACLALKMSHRFLRNSPHFLKTMKDIKRLRTLCQEERLSPKSPAASMRWGIKFLRINMWKKQREQATYDYAHPSLKQSKKDFFDDSVQYKYDHDSLHEAVAWPEAPAYKSYIKPDAEVDCSYMLFSKCSHETRLKGVYEEACVLALERSLIPCPGALTEDQAFRLALMKVCTSITSGWFREFAWEHYDEVVAIWVEDPVPLCEKLDMGIERCDVLPFDVDKAY